MKHAGRRREFLMNQGYSAELIEFFESCGVGKHLLWFLKEFGKFNSSSEFKKHSEDIRIVNRHIESIGKNKFKSFKEAFDSAYSELSKKRSLEKTAMYRFDDGHFIAAIPHSDLHGEGIAMSNCVGNYVQVVKSKERAMLALKSPSGETLVHFEILKNGLIAQNYEKANMPVRNKYWKYICEFLRANSKNIDSEKHFGFGWKLRTVPSTGKVREGESNSTIRFEVQCVIPKRISHRITKNGVVATIEESETLKSFDASIPQISFSGLNKEDLIGMLKNAKSEMMKSMDGLISNVESTEGSDLFVSDETKERLFGEGGYLMKGDDYGFFDMTMFGQGIVVAERPVNVFENEARRGGDAEVAEPAPQLGMGFANLRAQDEAIPMADVVDEEMYQKDAEYDDYDAADELQPKDEGPATANNNAL